MNGTDLGKESQTMQSGERGAGPVPETQRPNGPDGPDGPSGPDRAEVWGPTKGSRLAAALTALGGGLAIAGALLPWVSVEHGKKVEMLRGTSFAIGTMTLIAGIALIVCAVVCVAVSSARARVAFAVVGVAAGAAILIAVGAGLGTKAFLDQASTHVKKHDKAGKHGSNGASPSGSAIGAVFVPNPATGFAAKPSLTSTKARTEAVPFAKKGKKKNKAITSTLKPGVFISLGGGLLGLIGGVWLLLTPSGGRRRHDGQAAPAGTEAAVPPAPPAMAIPADPSAQTVGIPPPPRADMPAPPEAVTQSLQPLSEQTARVQQVDAADSPVSTATEQLRPAAVDESSPDAG
jgi:hypothetical protein